jgi:hypothetical protein
VVTGFRPNRRQRFRMGNPYLIGMVNPTPLARTYSPFACGKGCSQQLSFSGLARAPAFALLGATRGLPVIGA